jgi:hypothetical protein
MNNRNLIGIFHENFEEMKLKEAVIFTMEYDPASNLLISFTDYGHINLYHLQDLERCLSKTLAHENLPIYCSYLYESTSSSKIIFT